MGAYAAKLGIDVIVCIGDLAKDMYEGACEGVKESEAKGTGSRVGSHVHYFSQKGEFMEKWKDIGKEGDTVLVKASHGMAFEEIVKMLAG